jgi:hypothetical protein
VEIKQGQRPKMRADISEKEISGVLSAPNEKRLKYFIGMVASWSTLWISASEHGNVATFEDEPGQNCILVWPFKEFADKVVQEADIPGKVIQIEVYDFLKNYIKDLIANQLLICVFPDQNLDSARVTPKEFLNLMLEELSKIE